MTENNEKFIIHILSYLGVALIGGSIVHIGTLDGGSIRYIILGCVGVAMMIIGSVLEAQMKKEPININYLGIVTALAISTGLLSGGIQHFLDNPIYAGYLLAAGLIVSYISFAGKYHANTTTQGIITIAILALTIVLVSNTVVHESIPHTEGSEHH